jgi:hypothetical protein
MKFLSRRLRLLECFGFSLLLLGLGLRVGAQSSSSSSSPSGKHVGKAPPPPEAGIDPGVVADGVYRNKALSLSCKVPPGWVLRTDEMNAPEPNEADQSGDEKPQPQRDTNEKQRVLLAAFSRPPEAKGEDVNGSILIAAESVATYPGLKEAAQYFGPLTEVAKAQGFTVDEEPYEFAVGEKNLVRGDFHKDVGTRVMRQSTLAFLARGYAVSITVIGGTEDEVEDLVDGVSFTGK